MSLRRGLLVAALAGGALLLAHARCGVPPDPPDVIAGPDGGGIGVSYEFTATAATPDDRKLAIRFDWGDGRPSGWSAYVASGDSVTMSHAWSSPGTYGIKAQAKATAGATSDWSEPHELVVTTNLPPSTPATPSGPWSAPKDSTCTFAASATDPNDDSIAVRFDWGDGDTSGWTDWGPSGWSGTKAHAWGRSGIYAVRAQAKDASEAHSA